MTTKEFIALEKSLLPDLPGFTVSGRVMFVPPVKHTLRGVSFDPSAFDKKSFSTTVFVMPLFIPSKHLTLNFADRVRHKGKGDRWSIDMPELSAQLSTALKQQAVPFLYSLESLQDFISMAQQSLGDVSGRRSFKNPHTLQAIAYALARAGRCQQARDALDELLQQLDLKI